MFKTQHIKNIILLATVIALSTASAAFCADTKQQPEKLPQVTVTASAISEESDPLMLSPGVVTVIKPQELKGEQKSLSEILKMVPGLHVTEARGRGTYTVASIRGSTAAQVAVYVDGVLMNLGSEAAVDLSTIPADNIEQIEVYRGYIPARFSGASMGGVINIITKKATKPGGEISLGTGSFGKISSNLSFSNTLGNGNLFVGAGFERSNGEFEYLNDNNTPLIPTDDYYAKRQNNGYRNGNVLVKWTDKNWAVKGAWKKNDREIPYAAPGADKPTSPIGARQDTEQVDLSISRKQKTGAVDWEAKLDYVYQDKIYDDPFDTIGAFGSKHNIYRTDRLNATIDGSVPLGANHLLEFLTDYKTENLHVGGDIVSYFNAKERFSRDSWNIQLQDTISLNKAGDLLFTPLVRYNNVDKKGAASWSAALSKKFGEHFTLRASGGKYNRAPNLYELYGDGAFLLANQNLDWEDGVQWDLAVIWQGKIKNCDVYTALTYFGRRSHNLIEYINTSPRYARYENIGDAKINGLELENKITYKRWESYLSVTWMRAINTTENDPREDKAIPNLPEIEALFRLTHRFYGDKASAYAQLHYTGKNYFDTTEQILMGNLFTVGLGVKYRFNEKTNLVLAVDDLFDKSPDVKRLATGLGPDRTLYYPLQGRTFYATLFWEF